MTLIVGFKRGRNIIIAQDSAFVNAASGVMEGVGSKIIALPGIPAAIGFSGAVPTPQGVAYFADRANRILRPESKLADLLHAIPDIAGDAIACRMTIGVWDRKQREARLYTYANQDALAVPGLHAGELVEAEMLLGVSFEPSEVLGEGFGTSLTDAQLIELYEAQRQCKVTPANHAGAAFHGVGVLLTRVSVGKRSISEQSIWQWNDRMGEAIMPSPGKPFDIRINGPIEVAHAA